MFNLLVGSATYKLALVYYIYQGCSEDVWWFSEEVLTEPPTPLLEIMMQSIKIIISKCRD